MATDAINLVQVSDLHLDPDDAESIAKFQTVRQVVCALEPDVVVVSGDVSHDAFRNQGMLPRVRKHLLELGPIVHAVPGNHDVGDKLSLVDENPVRERFVDQWCEVFGQDRFTMSPGGPWQIVGLDSQIIGSGFAREAEQLAWLDDALAEADAHNRLLAVFLHMPVFLRRPDEPVPDRGSYWVPDPEARDALLRRLDPARVRLVASGHVHWHLMSRDETGAWRIWCPPACGLLVDDAKFPLGGDVAGIMQYRLSEAGIEPRLVPLDVPTRTVLFGRPKVELPGRGEVTLSDLVLDFTGTLSRDGALLPGVAQRLGALAQDIRIRVLSADTFGTAESALGGLPLQFHRIRTGWDKARYIERLGPDQVVAIGNGRNDVAMVKAAAVGIAVQGPEGVAAELLGAADIVTANILDALDLVANPLRLKATLRD